MCHDLYINVPYLFIPGHDDEVKDMIANHPDIHIKLLKRLQCFLRDSFILSHLTLDYRESLHSWWPLSKYCRTDDIISYPEALMQACLMVASADNLRGSAVSQNLVLCLD